MKCSCLAWEEEAIRVVMINDCASVGETLIAHFPRKIDVTHLKRSRSIFDKTLRIAQKIIRAKADVYHVHYLLQDCFLALRFGKHPIVGHAHGNDLRSTLKHEVWGRIVRYNLRHCDKVLVSTPDILNIARTFCESAEYIPTPVDTKLFYSIPPKSHIGKLKVLIASGCNWKVKGTDIAIRALSKITDKIKVYMIYWCVDKEKSVELAKSLDLPLNLLPMTSHEKINEYYWDAHVVIDQFREGTTGQTLLEAIACGRPVITYLSSRFDCYKDFPIKDVNTIEKIVGAIQDLAPKLWEQEYEYFKKHHDPRSVAEHMASIYRDQIECRKK